MDCSFAVVCTPCTHMGKVHVLLVYYDTMWCMKVCYRLKYYAYVVLLTTQHNMLSPFLVYIVWWVILAQPKTIKFTME